MQANDWRWIITVTKQCLINCAQTNDLYKIELFVLDRNSVNQFYPIYPTPLLGQDMTQGHF